MIKSTDLGTFESSLVEFVWSLIVLRLYGRGYQILATFYPPKNPTKAFNRNQIAFETLKTLNRLKLKIFSLKLKNLNLK